MKIGILGNTNLTKKGLDLCLALGHEISYVFGLSQEDLSSKVNASDLKPICRDKGITLYESNDFDLIKDIEIDLIISLGDSRLVPVSSFKCKHVIGNHGAELPYVKGGASLVWGRMINSGSWAVSLMELSVKLDCGAIIGVNHFNYPLNMPMQDFVKLCDDKTIDLLEDYLTNGITSTTPEPKDTVVTIKKGIDSEVGCLLAATCLSNKIPVYLPSRTPEDSKIKDYWSCEFKDNFRMANDYPYIKAK